MLQKIYEDYHISIRHIANELNIDQKTVLNHSLKAGYTTKLVVWVPHKLAEKFDGSNGHMRNIIESK